MCKHAHRWVVAIGMLACPAVALGGPEWDEPVGVDAGSTPPTAQTPVGDGAIKRIKGTLGEAALTGSLDTEDMFYIDILDPSSFVATTTGNPEDPENPGSAEFNTTLWLFDARNVEVLGFGLLGNRVAPPIVTLVGDVSLGDSTIRSSATDETESSIPGPGRYLICISTASRDCFSKTGTMFDFNDGPNETSGPDGEGGNDPILGWTELPGLKRKGGGQVGGAYTLALEGAAFAPPTTMTLELDIRPGVCPNTYNVYWVPGVLKVALLGGPNFDVNTIDGSTIQIRRADGTGSPVSVMPGTLWVEDVATPFFGDTCACHDLDGDGFDDLVMYFDKQELNSDLELDSAGCGAVLELNVDGQLNDGTPFTSSDCIVIVD